MACGSRAERPSKSGRDRRAGQAGEELVLVLRTLLGAGLVMIGWGLAWAARDDYNGVTRESRPQGLDRG